MICFAKDQISRFDLFIDEEQHKLSFLLIEQSKFLALIFLNFLIYRTVEHDKAASA